jgi:hypothetical protein
MRKIAFIFVGICLMVLSCILIEEGIEGLYYDHEFGGVGRTTGTIKRIWTVSNGRRMSRSCWATFSYQPGDDGIRETILLVSPTNYGRLQVDDPIPVKFLLREHTDSRIDWPEEDEWHWIRDISTVLEGSLIIGGTLLAGWITLPRKKSSWEDAAVKMDLGGKDRWS